MRTQLVVFAKVKSGYWEHNPGSEERVPKKQALIPVLSADQAAGYILSGIERNAGLVVEPWQLPLVLRLAHYFPQLAR